MDKDQKKTLFFGIILGTTFVIAVLYMVFNAFLNHGTISLSGDTPFLIEIVGGEQVNCELSPCEIKTKKGFQNLIIAKENHKTIVREVKVQLWQTQKLNLTFELIPQVEAINETLPEEKYYTYSLIYEESGHLYKLVLDQDPAKRAIVYFSKEIKNPKIFGGKTAALIVGENGIYKIDVASQTKTQITGGAKEDLQEILNGHFAEKSDNFAFRLLSSPNIFVLGSDNEVERTALIADRTLSVWTYDNQLLFITDQKIAGEDDMPLPDISTEGFYIGKYDPENNSYEMIKNFPEITKKPQSAIIVSNGDAIYLETEGGNLKISLR